MIRELILALAAGAVASATAAPARSEIPIPRSMADKGHYHLLEISTKGAITTTLHRRIGPSGTGYSKTEINCGSKQYRDVAYGEEGPDKLKSFSSPWTDLVSGSSKSDLAVVACRRR